MSENDPFAGKDEAPNSVPRGAREIPVEPPPEGFRYEERWPAQIAGDATTCWVLATDKSIFKGDGVGAWVECPELPAKLVANPGEPASGDRVDLAGYTLVFEDDFATLSVGSVHGKGAAKWGDWPPYGGSGAFSASDWAQVSYPNYAEVVKVEGGDLELGMIWNATRNLWESGCLASKDETSAGFALQYGYWSARMKMPNAGQGAWPAFWLMSENSIPGNTGIRLEVDILEWYGVDHAQAGSVGQTVHYWKADGGQDSDSVGFWGSIPGGDATQWHVYGCEINPAEIIYFVDGLETNRVALNSLYATAPMYIIIDYAIGGGWAVTGEPYASLGPSTLEVDWVRAYALPTTLSRAVAAREANKLLAQKAKSDEGVRELPPGVHVRVGTVIPGGMRRRGLRR